MAWHGMIFFFFGSSRTSYIHTNGEYLSLRLRGNPAAAFSLGRNRAGEVYHPPLG